MIREMRESARLLCQLFDALQPMIVAGTTTQELDDFCQKKMLEMELISGALGYHGFPKSICTSINSVVCHGIPDNQQLKNGDIISIDIAVSHRGYFADSCRTYAIGEVLPKYQNLIKITRETMWSAIEIIKSGIPIGTLSAAMQKCAERFSCNVIRDFCGHGIGRKMHEEPSIPFFGQVNRGEVLKSGMFITIEPMVTLGKPNITILDDQWTAIMSDGQYAAQFEHTVAVLDHGYEVLTFNAEDALFGKIPSKKII